MIVLLSYSSLDRIFLLIIIIVVQTQFGHHHYSTEHLGGIGRDSEMVFTSLMSDLMGWRFTLLSHRPRSISPQFSISERLMD
jgi:hypothetical protein